MKLVGISMRDRLKTIKCKTGKMKCKTSVKDIGRDSWIKSKNISYGQNGYQNVDKGNNRVIP